MVHALRGLGLWLAGPTAFRLMARHSIVVVGGGGLAKVGSGGSRRGSSCLLRGNQERDGGTVKRREGRGAEEKGEEKNSVYLPRTLFQASYSLRPVLTF